LARYTPWASHGQRRAGIGAEAACDEGQHAPLARSVVDFTVQARRRQQGILKRGIQFQHARQPRFDGGVVETAERQAHAGLVIIGLQPQHHEARGQRRLVEGHDAQHRRRGR
jgi:hypothetical protein